MKNNTVTFFDINGQERFKRQFTSLKTEPNRTEILRLFAQNSELAYLETNVRRYTAGDIYGNHTGTMI